MSEAEKEREAIVAWLRKQAEGFQKTAENSLAKGEERDARDRFAGKICCEKAAQAIERLDHHKESKDSPA